MKYLEIKSVEHKDIKVLVKIDYTQQIVSLVEIQENSSPTAYKPKDWRFHNREIDYLDGWLVILEAMAVAIKTAKKDLKEYLDEQSAKAVDLLAAIEKEELKRK